MENQPIDELEKEFGDLEVKLIDRMKNVYEENLKETPAGVAVEIVASEDKFWRLYLDSNRRWNIRYGDSGFTLIDNSLSNVLDHFSMVTNKPFRALDFDEQRQYVQINKGSLARTLIGKMQQALTELG